MIDLELVKNLIIQNLKNLGINVQGVYIFGSRARGDFSEESDYDIFTVIDDYNGYNKKQLWWTLYKSLHEEFPCIAFDILIRTVKEFEIEKQVVNTLSHEVLIEGKKI
ncbi:nucleotidyltransferase domain-containing protein [Anaerocellum danielii]|uniref:Nucleotidyltransferase domain-containing protein n=1 Tax=Anaerocellum danielii TaxID=1387557 RepID=A0ABZ0TWC3_9FIRM|nr:nucleotidyltransferase domain-containing protein [Caldicellulosiruptor danielii]WPX07749.1 nucleotidyltransferase domain-containing protein [Caldicellulosiruptor danielii]